MNASLVLPDPVRPSRQCRTSQCLALDTPRRHLTHLQTVGKDVENEKLSFGFVPKNQNSENWKMTIQPTPGFPWFIQECPSSLVNPRLVPSDDRTPSLGLL